MGSLSSDIAANSRPESPAVGAAASPACADHSRFVQRIRRRYVDELPLLPEGLPRSSVITAVIEQLVAGGRSLASALRVTRQLVLERLAVLDIERGASMADVTLAMTELAETTLDVALAQAMVEQDARSGPPLNAAGQRIDFWIVGMGKLGARELNVSSDIDLIYVYEDGGETPGPQRLSAHEYFSQVVRSLYALIGETTEDGFVFRVDLALRPNGNSGPPVVSLPMLEEYLQAHGREWERFAWLKSRVVAPRARLETTQIQGLRSMVNAFVYRRYLDYGVFEGLRQLHRKVRDEAQRRAAGRPERANDVKLSRGGIREIEFTVQLLQVVRGGQFPELRTRPTLEALQRVARAELMPPEAADALARAYVFLRRVEHRIQYLDDQQTHILPTQDADLDWIARTLGYDGVCPFLAELDTHREFVAQEFDRLLGGDAPCKSCQKGAGGEARAAPSDIDAVLPAFPERVRERLAEWPEHPRVLALRDEARGRLTRLLQRTAQWLEEGRVNEDGVLRLADWVEPLLRRESYIALLLERPAVHERLLRVLGAARWPARYAMQHPGVIDELASPSLLNERFDAAAFEQELELRREALARGGEDDEESLLNLLRRAHHAETFRTLARDVEGRITVEQVADDLSALADAILRLTMRWCWPRLRQKHRAEPRFGIIGYGKLGGKELGYGGDLDVVFVYDAEGDDDPDASAEVYAAFVRKLITWLTLRTAAGELFEIDTALRPNGNSGMLVSSIQSFEKYQVGRGSNTAWTWEHQAITRARFCAGDAEIGARFDEVRRQVLVAERDVQALRDEVRAMREKVRAAHPVRDALFDVKHSAGGMMDAEFVVQYLVLAHAAAHPQLQPNVGNIALLQRAEAAGLLPEGVGRAAADGYRELRRAQHRARLDEKPTQFAPELLAAERDAVQAAWRAVFG